MSLLILQTPTKCETIRPRQDPIACVIIHCTGETDTEKILWWYTHRKGEQPHYFIQTDGVIHQHVREDWFAWHAGIKPAERLAYRQGFRHWSAQTWDKTKQVCVDHGQELPQYRTWRDTWRHGKHLDSPLELASGTFPNGVSIGIEIQSPPRPRPQVFTDAEYGALAELLCEVTGRNKIPLDRDHVLTHSDVSPIRRSDPVRGLTDPGERFSFQRLWDLVAIVEKEKRGNVWGA